MQEADVLALGVRVVRSAGRQTQEEIAKANQVDRSVISNLEAAKIHRPELAFRIIDRGGGEELLDRIIEQMQRFREWFAIQRKHELLFI